MHELGCGELFHVEHLYLPEFALYQGTSLLVP